MVSLTTSKIIVSRRNRMRQYLVWCNVFQSWQLSDVQTSNLQDSPVSMPSLPSLVWKMKSTKASKFETGPLQAGFEGEKNPQCILIGDAVKQQGGIFFTPFILRLPPPLRSCDSEHRICSLCCVHTQNHPLMQHRRSTETQRQHMYSTVIRPSHTCREIQYTILNQFNNTQHCISLLHGNVWLLVVKELKSFQENMVGMLFLPCLRMQVTATFIYFPFLKTMLSLSMLSKPYVAETGFPV